MRGKANAGRRIPARYAISGREQGVIAAVSSYRSVCSPGVNQQRRRQDTAHHAEGNGDRNVVEIDD